MKAKWTYAAVVCLAVASTASFAEGDPGRGEGFYTVCVTCHGPVGEGMKEMNAPRLTGLDDWYIVRQLENFKNGVRGKDPSDSFGQLMAPMAMVLPDRQAMEDVAAYLKSLGK